MPWIRCVEPGCTQYRVVGPRCREHAREAKRKREIGRPSPSARGYGMAWRKLRAEILKRDNCTCAVPGCDQEANEVHHVKAKHEGGDDSPENLVSLCGTHHHSITGQQRHRIRFGGRP